MNLDRMTVDQMKRTLRLVAEVARELKADDDYHERSGEYQFCCHRQQELMDRLVGVLADRP